MNFMKCLFLVLDWIHTFLCFLIFIQLFAVVLFQWHRSEGPGAAKITFFQQLCSAWGVGSDLTKLKRTVSALEENYSSLTTVLRRIFHVKREVLRADLSLFPCFLFLSFPLFCTVHFKVLAIFLFWIFNSIFLFLFYHERKLFLTLLILNHSFIPPT